MLRFSAFLLSLFCLSAVAEGNRAVIFGDSLADEGRLYALTQGAFPESPFYEGRFSNGPVWPEYAFEERENYAYGGAKSDRSNYLADKFGELVDDTGLLGQIDEYILAHPDKAPLEYTAFYISIGANDVLALADEEEASLPFLIAQSISHIKLASERLKHAGATRISVVGLPDLSITPIAKDMSAGERALLSKISERFNHALLVLALKDDLGYVDMHDFTMTLIKHPALYGLKNVTDACFDKVTLTQCPNPNEYLFWDDKHPSTHVHELFATTVQ